MTLLEVIKNASVNSKSLDSPLDYPHVLDPDTIIPNLKPREEDTPTSSLVKPLIGWKISQADAEIIDIGKKFFSQLKAKLEKNLDKGELTGVFNSYLESVGEKVGVSSGVDLSTDMYTRIMIIKLGCLISKDVAALVLDVSLSLEIWDIVEALIEVVVVDYSCYSSLVHRLVEKKKSDLLCLCIKRGFNLGSSEVLAILKYFLSPSKEAYDSMMIVKKEWEEHAQLAIEKASDCNRKNLHLAKEASILLMLAYDSFSASEICLHYLVVSSNFNDSMLSSSFSKLSGKELINLIRYLSKWLKKFQRFPQAVPCPKASAVLGLEVCVSDFIPRLEDVVKCLGLVLDKNFSLLVLHPEFHEELRSVEGVVSSLATEAKFCFLMADVVEKLKLGLMDGQQ